MATTIATTPTLGVDDLTELDLVAFEEDPSSALRGATARVVRSDRGVEIIDYDLCLSLIADTRLRPREAADFINDGATPKIADFIDKGIFLFMPPERHSLVRRVFARGFTARKVNDSVVTMYEVANGLVDKLLADGTNRGDLVDGYSKRLSAEVLCRTVGFPAEDVDQFVDAAVELSHVVHVPMDPHVKRIEAALDLLHEYCLPLLEERRREPKDDFLSALISAEETDGRLTSEELIWGTVNLLLGGIDTTNFQLASSLQAFIVNGVWERLAQDPAAVPSALEEAMRLAPAPAFLSRIVAEDIVLDDVLVPAGTAVRLNVIAAGRDPRRFEDPDTFVVDRGIPFMPLGFGAGVHICVGKALAIMELKVGVEVLTSRLTNVALTEEPTMHAWTDAFFGPWSLNARWDVR